MSFDAILFDLDGTLIQTPEIIINAFVNAIKDFYPEVILSKDEQTNVLGQTLDKAFINYAKDSEELVKMIDKYRYYTSSDLNQITGYKYLDIVLKSLKEKGYLLGIVTSKTNYVVYDNIKDLDIEKYFDCIITHNDTSIHKPNPEPILLALEKLNVESMRTIYIGDHENDIIAGRNALVQTGLMAYSYRLEEALLESPNFVFKDLKEILKKL